VATPSWRRHNDVGQILFQSAAGIASLGRCATQLAAEADSLWSPRRAKDRAYYIGQRRAGGAPTAALKSRHRAHQGLGGRP
jgi:hypothetical protein